MLYVVVAGGDLVGGCDSPEEAGRITEAARKDDETVDITVHRLESVLVASLPATAERRRDDEGPNPAGGSD